MSPQTSFIILPPALVPHSLSLSSPLSVIHPLFSARCDQLGDISCTDIPGDGTSTGRTLLHLSSPCPPLSFSSPHLVVLSLLLLLPVSSPAFSLQSKQTSLLSRSPLNRELSSLMLPTVTHQPQPSSPPSLQSSILLFLSPLCSGYTLTVMHLPSSPLPSLLQLYSTFPFFSPLPSPLLYLALSRLPFTMTDLSSLLYANRSPVS